MNFLKAILLVFTIIKLVYSVKEDTDNNVCKLSKLDKANGTQNANGECVETFLGEIPNVNQMISTVIIFPKNNDVIGVNQPFTIKTKTFGLHTGFFDDPVTQYYNFPQTLDVQGFIQGHSHVTVQKIEDETKPLDPKVFAFFKGLNDPANGQGELNVDVEKGLPAGNYRLCTMVSSFGHQPALMPIAQRGAQDDCIRFFVKASN